MISETVLREQLASALAGVDLPFLGGAEHGKVRDIYRRTDQLILVTTDRLSAFDRILGVVPYKGQVLTQLAAFWFKHTADIIPNHLVCLPDPNVTIAHACTPLPVEVVVRGYITGVTSTALWYRYNQGERSIYGIDFPDGLNKNDMLPQPVITPTTKARDGGHDERITSAEVVAQGLVTAEHLEADLRSCHRRLSAWPGDCPQRRPDLGGYQVRVRPQPRGEVTLIDEVHTPDSSRFWLADTYEQRIAAGQEPDNFDKEFIRLYYAARAGYRGEGEPFPLPPDLAVQAAGRYIRTYELLTGQPFPAAEQPAGACNRQHNLRAWLAA